MMPQKVFGYKIDGYPESYVDPVSLRRELLRLSDGEFWNYISNAHNVQEGLHEASKISVPENPEEADRFKAAIRHAELQLANIEHEILTVAYKAFGWPIVDPQTGVGVPQSEALRVLIDFLEYAEKKE